MALPPFSLAGRLLLYFKSILSISSPGITENSCSFNLSEARYSCAVGQWLDHKHCENATFRELATGNGLLVQVGFGDAAVASEFASQFGGATAAGDDQGLAAR